MTTSLRTSPSLRSVIASYLALKKALGRHFVAETSVLENFGRFIASRRNGSRVVTAAGFAAWSLTLTHLSPTVRRSRMRMVRNLCLYIRRSEPECFIPDPSCFPTPHQTRRPYIFTEEQVVRLLRAAAKLRPGPTSPLSAEVFRLAIVLLYTAGLRRGEVVRLVISDYDPAERTLLVRASKFHKSRLIALSHDAVREIEKYLQVRRRLPHNPGAPLLVCRKRGFRAYTGEGLRHGLRSLFRDAEIRDADGRLPCVHDLRHTHAVHALLRWYRAGADVQAKLPALSTAMGHVSIASTAYYLGFLQPIAQAASERFTRHCETALPDIGGNL